MLIEWHEGMSVGVGPIDDEHKKLITLLNALHQAIEEGRGQEILATALNETVNYCNYHFSHEESLFMQSEYPDKKIHKQQHEGIKEQLFALTSKLKDGPSEELSIEFLIFLKRWLVFHIQETDMKYVAYLKNISN